MTSDLYNWLVESSVPSVLGKFLHPLGDTRGFLVVTEIWLPSIYLAHLIALRHHPLHVHGERGAAVLLHLLPHLRALVHHRLHVRSGHSALLLLSEGARRQREPQGEYRNGYCTFHTSHTSHRISCQLIRCFIVSRLRRLT